MEYVVEAFSDITSSRQAGFGLSPVAYKEIYHYASVNSLPDDFETFLRLFRALDNEYLETLDRKLKQQNGNKSQARN